MEKINELVKRSVENYCEHHNLNYDDVFKRIQWDNLNGCFYFYDQMLYVGIEIDGYLHT